MEKADPTHAAEYRRQRWPPSQADLTRPRPRAARPAWRTAGPASIVVSHDAFEYLGRRYGLDVHAIAGLSPDAEPSAKRLGELAGLTEVARDHHDLQRDPGQPQAGRHAGRATRACTRPVLDPIEGLSSSDPHADYLSLMRPNLHALQKAGGCS